jgi:hypothetical protein
MGGRLGRIVGGRSLHIGVVLPFERIWRLKSLRRSKNSPLLSSFLILAGAQILQDTTSATLPLSRTTALHSVSIQLLRFYSSQQLRSSRHLLWCGVTETAKL